MNCYELIELLENKKGISFNFNEIFYDDDDVEINVDEFHDDEIDVDDEYFNKFDYLLLHNNYDYELIIDVENVDDVDELKKAIEKIDDEIHVEFENDVELIYRND